MKASLKEGENYNLSYSNQKMHGYKEIFKFRKKFSVNKGDMKKCLSLCFVFVKSALE